MEQKNYGFNGCEFEYNVNPPEERRSNKSVYGPFLDKFMEDEDALTIRVKANDRKQAANIAAGLRQAAIRAGYDNINVRLISNVYVYVSKN